MTARLSTASGVRAHTLAAMLLGSLSLVGCVDTHGALEEFTGRVVDASEAVPIDAPPLDVLPDVTGQFLLGLSPAFAPEAVVRFIVDAELTMNDDDETGTLTMSLQPITVPEDPEDPPGGNPIGPPLIADGVVEGTDAGGVPIIVGANGLFQAAIGGEVDGDANPASGSDLVFTAIMYGQLRTEDIWCGAVDGQVTQPAMLPIDGSTFGAIRIVPGTIGDDNLPAVTITCPAGPSGDAGVDGGPDDAGVGDAPPADAPAPPADGGV
jgi:hypothetical protein